MLRVISTGSVELRESDFMTYDNRAVWKHLVFVSSQGPDLSVRASSPARKRARAVWASNGGLQAPASALLGVTLL